MPADLGIKASTTVAVAPLIAPAFGLLAELSSSDIFLGALVAFLLAVSAIAGYRLMIGARRTRQTLSDSQAQLRAIIDNSTASIFVVESRDRLAVVNHSCELLFGAHHDQALGKTLADFFPKELADQFHSNNHRAVESGLVSRFEATIPYPEGPHTCVVTVVPIRNKQGSVQAVGNIVNDFTERRLIEDQLRQAQKMESMGRLAGGVAHDFNNLLTAIIGYSDLLLQTAAASDPLLPYVEEIKKAGDQAASLTAQLLAFSRKQIMQPKVLDLNEQVADTEAMLRRIIGEDIKFITVLPAGLWQVKADPNQIQQVIINLAVNARDAMPDGGTLAVETANVYLDESYAQNHISVKPGPHVMVAVSDTGQGMDQATRTRVFEPFFTTKEIGKGTGLGLYTVYGILKESGGNIWVYSEPGHGTTLKIYLPRVDVVAGKVQAYETPLAVQGKETILVVEDEDTVRKLIQGILERYGYRVLSASYGPDAIAISEQFDGQIQLMITDVIMPDMSGRLLAERMSSLRPQTRVLFMSGYTNTMVFDQGIIDAKAPFIQKPFSATSLLAKVREMLD